MPQAFADDDTSSTPQLVDDAASANEQAPTPQDDSRDGEAEPGFHPLQTGHLCPWHLRIDGDWIPYCRNLRLGPRRTHIRQAVIVVHGKNRNARDYYTNIERIAREEGTLETTMLLAPQFLTEADVAVSPRRSKLTHWSRAGWKNGHRSLSGQKTSSFEVLDRILKRLVDQNPNLKRIVIAGHSAGAQFAQRHAASRHVDMDALGVRLRYVITNPGNYMYLSKRRPATTAGCPETYNDYMYGYEDNIVQYFSGLSVDTLRRRFAQHPVYLLLGDKDTDPDDTDTSCEAKAQGAHRFERGQRFFEILTQERTLLGASSPTYNTTLRVINDVGHDHALMFDSNCGRSVLFGDGRCTPPASFAKASSTPELIDPPGGRRP